MLQLDDIILLPHEDRILLAIAAMKSDVLLSQRSAAAVYGVP
jgi:hypothetical protein